MFIVWVSVGQEPGSNVAEWFWRRVSQEVMVKRLAEATSAEELGNLLLS